ncbi:MAG: septum formation initiator family protein [Ignavibacteria bacterium]|nr:septum formation initiator family protein [Ignavibacteria bacterium]
MKLSREKQFFFFVITVLFMAGAAFLVFNDRGLIKYNRMKSQVDSLGSVIHTLENENTLLQNSIDSLKGKVPSKINRISREKYNMKGQQESVISVQEK